MQKRQQNVVSFEDTRGRMAYVDPTSLPPTLLPPNRTIQSFAGTVQPRLISTDKFITKSGEVV